jgi:hypothetical protein
MNPIGLGTLLLLAAVEIAQPQQPPRAFRSFAQLPKATPTQNRFLPPDRDLAQNEPRFYLCPKDGALLRVPTATKGTKFLCPVDGAEMAEGKGPSKKLFLLEEE